MKLEYIVVYENTCSFENCRVKVKVKVNVVLPHCFPHLPQYKMSRSRSMWAFPIVFPFTQYKLSGPITQLWEKLGSL